MHLVSQTTGAPAAFALGDEKSPHTSHTTMETTDTSNKIVDIIFEYALNKFNDSMERLAVGRPKFLSVIEGFVATGTMVKMCLPAFPFKSANKVSKVFGILPDKAEELAMERLNTLCLRIGNIHPPGAKLTVISDGLVYNGTYRKMIQSIVILGTQYSFCIDRPVGYIGSRYLGLWRSFTYNGCTEGIQPYRFLTTQ